MSETIILASTSPRRRDLMTEAGFQFDVVPPHADESFRRGDFLNVRDVALALAERKADSVAPRFPARCVIASDTLVEAPDGEILGRPRDRADARRMISALSGSLHRVHTAVAVRANGRHASGVDTAEVIFHPLSAEKIEEYVETGEGDDKAGAYGYQERGRNLVASVMGDPQTVVGLPIRLVRDLLSRCGFLSPALLLLLAVTSPARAQGWTEYRQIPVVAGERAYIKLEDSPVLRGGDTGIVAWWSDPVLVVMAGDTRERRLRFDRSRLGPLELVIRPTIAQRAMQAEAAPVSAQPVTTAVRPPASQSTPSAYPVNTQPATNLDIRFPLRTIEAAATSFASPPRAAARVEEEAEVEEVPFVEPPPIAEPAPTLVLTTPPSNQAARPNAPAPTQPAASPPRATSAPPVIASATARMVTDTPLPAAGRFQDQAGGDLNSGRVPIPATVMERVVPRGSTMKIDTSILATAVARPGELAIFSLAADLLARGLYGDAIDQFMRLLVEFPKTTLRDAAMLNMGQAYKKRAEQSIVEALRQRDLRRTGAAIQAIDAAITDYSKAVGMFRDVLKNSPKASHVNATQLAIAESLHGQVSAQFQKGGIPQDSPAVVVEYLRAFVGTSDTSASPAAKLGIARYYRDLGDARLLAKADKAEIRQAYERAVEEYQSVIGLAPMSSSAEESLIDMARLFDRNLEMRRFGDAVKFYNELVTRFPGSVHAAEAGERAKWIRTNYL
ncbi:MAG: Maf family nucleotide pyrophosphatase [Candidatus Hydrogenedentota bacterium]